MGGEELREGYGFGEVSWLTSATGRLEANGFPDGWRFLNDGLITVLRWFDNVSWMLMGHNNPETCFND